MLLSFTCVGHADFVQTEQGNWWAVFLGSRQYYPYEKSYVNTGRETFLALVEWIDGWPVINLGKETVQYNYSLPLPLNKSEIERDYSGNFTWRDEFVIQLYKSDDSAQSNNQMELVASKKLPDDQLGKKLYLEIEANGNTYSFSYAFEPNQWNLLKDSVDAKYLSTRIAGGFVGCMYALYATSLGRPSSVVSYFDWFEYQGNDEVYKISKKKNNY